MMPSSAVLRLAAARSTTEGDEDDMFVAEVPTLPGCLSQGRTRAEALKNIHEALRYAAEAVRERELPLSAKA